MSKTRRPRQTGPVQKSLQRSPSPTFGAWLRQTRTEAQLSQGELAGKLNVSQAYLSRLEKGRRPPPSEPLNRKLAQALNTAFSANGQRRDVTDELNSLARAEQSRHEDLGPATLTMDSVRQEQEHQSNAEEVWVVARRPLELDDRDYRDLVVDGVCSADPRRYVYWTSEPQVFDELRELLEQELVSRRSLTSVKAAEIVRVNIKCILGPAPLAWFSFVLYDPQDAYIKEAYLSHERGDGATGRVFPMEGTAWVMRASRDLRGVFNQLVVLNKREHIDISGAKWRRHFPQPGVADDSK